MKHKVPTTWARLIVGLCCCWAVFGAEQTRGLTSFKLEDQFGKVQSCEFPGERGLVIVACNKEGAKHVTGWVDALKETCGESVGLFGVADVRGVPEMIRPMIRSSFKKKYQHQVLLDWKGEVLDAIGFKQSGVLIVVADAKGMIRWQGTGEVTGETKKMAIEAVHGLAKK